MTRLPKLAPLLASALLLPATATAAPAVGAPAQAQASAPAAVVAASDRPDVVALLAGYSRIWAAAPGNTLTGRVVSATTLQHDDRVAVWINRHATASQRFKALQDSAYEDGDPTRYDQSLTLSTGLGSRLGRLYVRGRNAGDLPLTSALINSTDGSAGAWVSASAAKVAYSHPRPYLPSDPAAARVAGDSVRCAPSVVNAASQRSIRRGRSYADAAGNLRIERVAPTTDRTHQFSASDVRLDPSYARSGLCTGGSFPSGHTSTAYAAGTTLATLLPRLAPQILARASEAGNDRVVLGVHYPLDVMGGRIYGQAAVAARWSDAAFRTDVLEPARAELVAYLRRACGTTLTACIAAQQPYTSDPYGGQSVPGGTAQVVADRADALAVYRERLTYGFDRIGTAGLDPSVPEGAQNLLRTAFPTLTAAQRRAVLAQTQIDSGYPLDLTSAGQGSWQRLDLAAAMSAEVQVRSDGSVEVLATGGRARVVAAS